MESDLQLIPEPFPEATRFANFLHSAFKNPKQKSASESEKIRDYLSVSKKKKKKKKDS